MTNRPSQNTQSRNALLLTMVGLIALQIPTTIEAIEPPWLRAVFQLSALLIVVALSISVTISERMPKAGGTPETTPEPDTLRDTPKGRLPPLD